MIKTLLILRKRTDRKITRQLHFLVCYNLQGRQEEDAKRQNIRSETIAKGDRGLFAPSPTKGSFIGVRSFSGFLLERRGTRRNKRKKEKKQDFLPMKVSISSWNMRWLLQLIKILFLRACTVPKKASQVIWLGGDRIRTCSLQVMSLMSRPIPLPRFFPFSFFHYSHLGPPLWLLGRDRTCA